MVVGIILLVYGLWFCYNDDETRNMISRHRGPDPPATQDAMVINGLVHQRWTGPREPPPPARALPPRVSRKEMNAHLRRFPDA